MTIDESYRVLNDLLDQVSAKRPVMRAFEDALETLYREAKHGSDPQPDQPEPDGVGNGQ